MVWTTPAGFRVVHETREPKTQRIATSDRTLIVYQEDETRKIDSRRQADGIVALNRLGIAEQTQRKSMFQAGATESMASVANGRTDVAFALVSEIVPAAGVQLAGPLPSELDRRAHV